MTDPTPIDTQQLAAAGMRILMEDPMFKVGEAEIRGNVYRVFENAPPSMTGLFAFGASHGDKEFLYFEGERLSFAETWARACRFAHALQETLGVQKGDRVALAMRNFPEWCIAYMGVIATGAVVVPLNAWWKTDELKYGLEDSGAKLVIVDKKRLEYAKTYKDELGLTLVLAREEGEGADYRYEELLASSDNQSPPQVEIEPDDDFCIIYTSGSTGNPKGLFLPIADAYRLLCHGRLSLQR